MTRPDDLLVQSFNRKTGVRERTKAKIVEAYLRRVLTEGTDQVNLAQVAQAMKTSRAKLAYHFADHEQLADAAFRYILIAAQEEAIAAIQSQKDPRKMLIQYACSQVTYFCNNPAHAVVLLSRFAKSLGSQKNRESLESVISMGQKRMTALLSQFLPENLALQRSFYLQDYLFGSVLRRMTSPRNELSSMQEEVKKFCEIIMEP